MPKNKRNIELTVKPGGYNPYSFGVIVKDGDLKYSFACHTDHSNCGRAHLHLLVATTSQRLDAFKSLLYLLETYKGIPVVTGTFRGSCLESTFGRYGLITMSGNEGSGVVKFAKWVHDTKPSLINLDIDCSRNPNSCRKLYQATFLPYKTLHYKADWSEIELNF